MNEDKRMLKQFVRSVYDIQKLRIQVGNRIAINFRTKLGQEPGTTDETIDSAEAKKLLKKVVAEYKRITDGIVKLDKRTTKKVLKDHKGVISTDIELKLIELYVSLLRNENSFFRGLESQLDKFPIWTEFLEHVNGVGPAMAGVIISELDPHKAKYPSSFWAYAGLSVINGEGCSRRRDHLVKRTYVDSEGNVKETVGLRFNPWLKTKLVGVLATSFLRSRDSEYAEIYYDYKNRIENHPAHKDKTKAHRNRMALRYMIKIFLLDLWTEWRRLEGLPLSEPYHVAKLGLSKHSNS